MRMPSVNPILDRLKALRSRGRGAPPVLLLDFAGPQRRHPGLALAVLGLGALLFCLALWQSGEALDQQASAETRLSALEQQRNITRKRPSARAGLQESEINEQVRKANGVIRQLALPWDRMFDAMEKATSRDVAVLTMEPDAGRGQLRASGEAKNIKAMLLYLDTLGNSGFLRHPVLVSHQVKVDDPQRPVQFTFVTSWSHQ